MNHIKFFLLAFLLASTSLTAQNTLRPRPLHLQFPLHLLPLGDTSIMQHPGKKWVNVHQCATLTDRTYSFTGIGAEKAAAVCFETLTNAHLDATSDFLDAREGSIEALEDLIALNPSTFSTSDMTKLVAAWNAVGVYADHQSVLAGVQYDLDVCADITDIIGYPVYRAINLLRAGDICEESPYVTRVRPTATTEFKAGNEILLRPGFSAESGSNFLAQIVIPCNEFFSSVMAGTGPTNDNISLGGYDPGIVAGSPTIHAHPNPVHDNSQIYFAINAPADIDIGIYDAYGHIVKSLLVHQYKEIGKYSLNLDATEISPGLYYCILRTSNSLITHKMIVL